MIADEFESWRPLLTSWLASHGAPDPESAVQDVWIKCHLAELRGQEVSRSYAFVAAHSCMVDQFRKQRRYDPHPLDPDRFVAPDPTSDIPDPAYVARLLAPLTEKQRAVLLLDAEGMRQKEIAARLGIRVDTVKKLKHRAIRQARLAA